MIIPHTLMTAEADAKCMTSLQNTEGWMGRPEFSRQLNGAISCCELPVQVLVVDFLRSPIAEYRMKPCPIIAELDIPRTVFPCSLPGRVNGTVDTLDFQGYIERFREGIVKADPSPADGLADPEPLQDSANSAGV
jgi:hypothetical protein